MTFLTGRKYYDSQNYQYNYHENYFNYITRKFKAVVEAGACRYQVCKEVTPCRQRISAQYVASNVTSWTKSRAFCKAEDSISSQYVAT